jgi:1,4-alpha-glucan branching enzyme
VILNTDSSAYDGSNFDGPNQVEAEVSPFNGQPASIVLTLPPLAGLYLVPA